MSVTDDKIHWRYIPEDRGGTIAFRAPLTTASPDPDDLEHLSHVGTWGCIFCVGVYFKIDDHRAFCAHIHGEGDEPDRALFLTEAEGEKLTQVVDEKLRRHADESSWKPEKIDTESLILVCPRQTLLSAVAGKSQSLPGWYIVEGIKRFLSLPENAQADARHSGFIVDYCNVSRTVMIPFDSKPARVSNARPDKELEGYVDHVPNSLDGWRINPEMEGGIASRRWADVVKAAPKGT